MKSKLSFFIAIACLLCSSMSKAQDLSEQEEHISRTNVLENSVRLLQKFKVSGYIQAQYQYAEIDAASTYFKLQNPKNAYDNLVNEDKDLSGYSRFGVRRGRIKFTYEDGLVQGVIQPDFTQGGTGGNTVMFKDVYLSIKDPWLKTCSFKAGIFDRPFGHEVAYSSSTRESPERARVIQNLCPDERDLGFMLTLQAPISSPLSILKLEAGLFAGNGIKPQIDSHMDFIGHLSATKLFGDNLTLSGGVSLYSGGLRQMNADTYIMKDNKFVLREPDPDKAAKNIGKIAKRQYVGLDLQLAMSTRAGFTRLRGEYIFGENPTDAGGTIQNRLTALFTDPVYVREFSGGYVILAQDLGRTPFTFVAKYDWFNPNTNVKGDNILLPNTKKDEDGNDVYINGFTAKDKKTATGDCALNTIGLGLIWRINPALKLTAYYDIADNETTVNSKNTYYKDKNGNENKNKVTAYGWEGKRKANVFTLRLQYKF